MCKYCEINIGDCSDNIYEEQGTLKMWTLVYLQKNRNNTKLIFDGQEEYAAIPINNCPNCGEEL